MGHGLRTTQIQRPPRLMFVQPLRWCGPVDAESEWNKKKSKQIILSLKVAFQIQPTVIRMMVEKQPLQSTSYLPPVRMASDVKREVKTMRQLVTLACNEKKLSSHSLLSIFSPFLSLISHLLMAWELHTALVLPLHCRAEPLLHASHPMILWGPVHFQDIN